METYRIISSEDHNALVKAAYEHRGYTSDEADYAAQFAALAAVHGIRTHNALKALHLDHLFGSVTADVCLALKLRKPARFKGSETWDARRNSGRLSPTKLWTLAWNLRTNTVLAKSR